MPSQGPIDDEALANLLASDLDDHFHLVVVNYSPLLRAYVMRIMGQTSDVDDIVQETFFKAYSALRNYPNSRIVRLQLRPWLSVIAKNLALNYMTRKRKVLDEQLSVDTLEVQERIEKMEQGQLSSPEMEWENKENVAELLEYIRLLPEQFQTPLVLHYISDLSYEEIARILQKPVNTVKSQGRRAMKMLQHRIHKGASSYQTRKK